MSNSFANKVREVVRQIPRGQVLSYLAVAKKAGNPKAARAVASIMSRNYDETVPCHRVIRSDGKIGGYNRGGETAKIKKLASEGWFQ